MDSSDLSWKFWAAFVGVVLLGGIGLLISFMIFGAVWANWGFLGAVIVLCAVLLGIAYVFDRRHARPAEEL